MTVSPQLVPALQQRSAGPAAPGTAGQIRTATALRLVAPTTYPAPTSSDRGDRPGPPQRLDLRLHAPIPQAVIVRVTGVIDRPAETLLRTRVGEQLRRFSHVVLDLGGVHDLRPTGVEVLLDLQHTATLQGATLYLTGADHDAIRRPLRLSGADRLLAVAPAAETVIALLRR